MYNEHSESHDSGILCPSCSSEMQSNGHTQWCTQCEYREGSNEQATKKLTPNKAHVYTQLGDCPNCGHPLDVCNEDPSGLSPQEMKEMQVTFECKTCQAYGDDWYKKDQDSDKLSF